MSVLERLMMPAGQPDLGDYTDYETYRQNAPGIGTHHAPPKMSSRIFAIAGSVRTACVYLGAVCVLLWFSISAIAASARFSGARTATAADGRQAALQAKRRATRERSRTARQTAEPHQRGVPLIARLGTTFVRHTRPIQLVRVRLAVAAEVLEHRQSVDMLTRSIETNKALLTCAKGFTVLKVQVVPDALSRATYTDRQDTFGNPTSTPAHLARAMDVGP